MITVCKERMGTTEYYMKLAADVALRSTCIRRQVGAIAVVDNRIVATGYNGVPSGVPHCTTDTCYRMSNKIPSGRDLEHCFAVHAEQNLLVQCAYHGVSMKGAIVYLTHSPCTTCLKLLKAVGVHTLYARECYPDDFVERVKTTMGIGYHAYVSDTTSGPETRHVFTFSRIE